MLFRAMRAVSAAVSEFAVAEARRARTRNVEFDGRRMFREIAWRRVN